MVSAMQLVGTQWRQLLHEALPAGLSRGIRLVGGQSHRDFVIGHHA